MFTSIPWEAWVTLATVAFVLYMLITNRASPDTLLVCAAVGLTALSAVSRRFPTPGDMARACGNEGVLTVAALFVIVAALRETGAVMTLGAYVFRRPRSLISAQTRLMLPVVAVSAFINNTPVVAAFLPIVQDWARKTGIASSKLLIPLSYAAVLGGCCTLVGTSTNLVVQALLIEAQKTDPRVHPMGLFTLTPLGVPLAIIGVGFILLASPRLLPDRRTPSSDRQDPRQYAVEMLVDPGSPIAGQTIEQAGLRQLPGMFLASIERQGEQFVAVPPDYQLRARDRLEFVGVVESVVHLRKTRGLSVASDQVFKLNGPHHDRCLVEAVVSSTCPVVGQTVREGRFRTRYDAVIIAVHRAGERVACKIGDIVLKAGDTLLLETHPHFLKYYRDSRDFFLTSAVDDSQAPRHEKAWIALTILAGVILAAGFESFTRTNIFEAALIGAVLVVLTRCCSVEQAHRSIDWPLVIAIASSLVLGRAIETSGLAEPAARAILAVSQVGGPWGVIAGLYLTTLLLTEAVTNNAAAALAFPLARATATALDVNLMPLVVTITIAASAGFATPLGYQTHLMVYGPGGYRFGDFVRIGVPLDLTIMVATVALCPLLFPFR